MTVMNQRADKGGFQFGLGETLALIAAACYAGVNVFLKPVSGTIDPFVGSLVRLLPLLVIISVMAIVVRPVAANPKSEFFIGGKILGLLVFGGTMSFLVGNSLLFSALNLAGVAIATAAVQAGSVLGGVLISWAFLKERPTNQQLVGAGIIVIGLVFMASPGFLNAELDFTVISGILVAMISGFCYTISNAASRAAQRKPGRSILTLLVSNAAGATALFITIWALHANPFAEFAKLPAEHWGAVLIAGLVNAVALASVTLSVRYTTVTKSVMITSLSIAFGALFGVLFFEEILQPLVLLGLGLVLLGVIVGQLSAKKKPVQADFETEVDLVADPTK